MKYNFFILIYIFLAVSLFAQNDTINQKDNNGLPHGYWEKYKEGKLFYKGHFNHGNPIGEFTYFYPDNIIKTKLSFSDNGKKAYAIHYYKNGKKYAEGMYYDKKKEGKWIYYDGFDHIIAIENYKNGELNGISYDFFPNGDTLQIANYVNGKKNGEYRLFYPTKSPRIIANYKNDTIQGLTKYFYSNGQVYEIGKYRDGLRDSLWIMYDENGVVILTELYNYGSLIERKVYQPDKDPMKLEDDIIKNIDLYRKGIIKEPSENDFFNGTIR
ncbi:MAG TPA: toxin-antitoxin system YwqK family antitoxin [Bacteroidales bacterium]|jgi:antitoxin component YwqK of YwqJK toxin-antitoxin module|nr:toxin-antitoxin system YwqK family antitoxin [Bacteroidales bacterium]HOB27511.1 toxin-antitoxin system YwqK family antitoxin [Bacteroidales bacterium]HPU46058.1 toxin-antitoxin system YwqK family antitoxin [Bacteroidales bacterium]HPZ36592.1 toxin-antitoxin system YwqK family antitoxin [Bacteroidales bacterium]HQD35255.1 toxin-antitoxin system YwqK family antitoxin [Bacteroidales bacterium]